MPQARGKVPLLYALPLILLLPLLSGVARAADPAATQLSYRVYAGGLHVLDATLAIGEGRRGYRASLEAETAGAVDWFSPFSFRAEAEGARQDARLRPHRYEALSQREGDPAKRLTIEYDSAALPEVTAEPARDDLARTGLSRAQRANTYDPISGVIQLLDAALAGGACADEVAIFDGKRRLEVKARDGGEVTLAKSRYNIYEGRARRCDIEVGDIRGKDVDARKLKRVPRQLTIFLARPAPNLAAVPVRAEVDSVIGRILLHLTAVRPPARSQAALR